ARIGPSRLFLEALIQHDLGNAAESRKALDTLIAKHAGAWAYQIAEIHARRGERDRAFEWLELAREHAAKKGSALQADTGMDDIKTDPLLRTLHGDPRWKPFLRKMNLPVD
ncbi:MAG TPA: hypothetical protein VIV59_13785, partial [Anaeromyxobacteraceae bacterium]